MAESNLKTLNNLAESLQGLLVEVGLLIFALFIHFSNDRVYELSDLRSLEVVLTEKPKYDTSANGKSHRNVKFRAYGFSKDFKITNFTFKSTDHQRLKMDLNENDTVSVWITESDANALKRTELINNYNEIFGLVHNSYNYINFDDRNQYQSSQNKWGKIILGILGIVFVTQNIQKIKKKQQTKKTQ